MRKMSFVGGVMFGAAVGSVACMVMMPSRKSKHILSKTLRTVSDVIDGFTTAVGW